MSLCDELPRIQHGGSIALESTIRSKQALREELARETEEFLIKGGVITSCDTEERATENVIYDSMRKMPSTMVEKHITKAGPGRTPSEKSVDSFSAVMSGLEFGSAD
jgi:hypothetical protein